MDEHAWLDDPSIAPPFTLTAMRLVPRDEARVGRLPLRHGNTRLEWTAQPGPTCEAMVAMLGKLARQCSDYDHAHAECMAEAA